ncbi:MAG: hypothetical protein DCC50_14235 [Acidobacteria bacterium]|nr:MAG: hypothetical protein DCC50_14235 [Acidobacteriota bacterium]
MTTALVGAALVLAGCSGEDDTGTAATSAPGDASGDASGGTDEGDAATTDAPAGDGTTTDDASTTAGPGTEDGVEGGEEGQAAADVAKDFLVAMVDADPRACDHLLSFTDLDRPMTEVESDHEMCVELLPEVLKAETEAQGLDPAAADALQDLQISGADVDGDTAVVDADNYPEDFAAAMGGTKITLKRVSGDWYVDLDNSFATPTDG